MIETGRVLRESYKQQTMVIGYGPAKKISLAMRGRRFTGLAAFLCEGCWAQFRKLLAEQGASRPKCYPPFCPRRRRVQAGIRCPRFHILGTPIPLQAQLARHGPPGPMPLPALTTFLYVVFYRKLSACLPTTCEANVTPSFAHLLPPLLPKCYPLFCLGFRGRRAPGSMPSATANGADITAPNCTNIAL